MKHYTNAYKDGYKWIVYCMNCGQEEPKESSICPGQPTVIPFQCEPIEFKSGLAEDIR